MLQGIIMYYKCNEIILHCISMVKISSELSGRIPANHAVWLMIVFCYDKGTLRCITAKKTFPPHRIKRGIHSEKLECITILHYTRKRQTIIMV